MLELRRLTQEEAIEQRPAIQRHRGGMIPSPDGSFELDHVHLYDIGVQPKEIALGKERGLGQGLTEDVGRDLEKIAPALGVAFRPQGCDQVVPGKALTGGHAQQREQSDAMPLRGSAGSRTAVGLERWTAQESEMENRRGFQGVYRADTGGSPPSGI